MPPAQCPLCRRPIGRPLAKLAVRVMSGKSLEELGFTNEVIPGHIAAQRSGFATLKSFPGTDTLLGLKCAPPERSWGLNVDFGKAFAKAELAASQRLPLEGTVFISMNDRDKAAVIPVAQELSALGFKLVATSGTQKFLMDARAGPSTRC